MATNEAFGC
uniref:Uncharacterized protein n=1 Tax=Arundo donax TaxID=35708 RepID=A0A0A9G716_ARUDO